MPVNLNPFGAIVGTLLMAVASVPLWTDTGANHPDTRQLTEELRDAQQSIDELSRALNRVTDQPGESIPSTTAPPTQPPATTPGSGISTTVPVPVPDIAPTDPPVQPPTSPTVTTTVPTVPPTTTPPTTVDDGCPVGYHPVARATIPPGAAWVCLHD